MPTSRPYFTSWLCDFILETKPKSILDIGVGFGSFGVLAREYTDIWNGNYQKYEWLTRIDGVEIFKNYRNDIYWSIYNNIYMGDICDVVDTLNISYDLILIKDCLEHIEKENGKVLLEKINKLGRFVVIITPIEVFMQGPVFGNDAETHRSSWCVNDFKKAIYTEEVGNALLVVIENDIK